MAFPLEVYVNGRLFDFLPLWIFNGEKPSKVIATVVQYLPGGVDYEFAIAGF